MSTRLRILLLCDDRPGNANTILDHINAFRRYSRHEVRTFNPRGMGRSLGLDLKEFDVVVIHYSLILSSEQYVSRDFREKLARFQGLKVQFIQDEYRWVDRVTATGREVGIQILYTSVPEEAAGRLYDERLPGVARIQTLTGYVPEDLTLVPRRSIADRPLDVAYRGRDLPFWLGRLGYEKQLIGQRFAAEAPKYDLRLDIGWREEDRIYGRRWIDFIASSRATLGTESGASIADFDGSIERKVRSYLRDHRGAGFDEVEAAVLRPYEGNVVINVVSPRVFEAAALGTSLVMFPGEYSGVVAPGEHYIVLEKDFSNLEVVAARLKDSDYMAGLTRRAFDDLIASGRWSYRRFVVQFDQVVSDAVPVRRSPRRAPRRHLAKLEKTLTVPPPQVRLIRLGLGAAAAVRGRRFAHQAEFESASWIRKGNAAIRAVLSDQDFRQLLIEARRQGASLDGTLEEILELSLLRQAAMGTLDSVESFAVTTEFDPKAKVLTFVSRPRELVHREVVPDLASADWTDAFRFGALNAVEWDHSAVGESVHLTRSSIEIGIGARGIRRFDVIMDTCRRNQPLLKRLMTPALEAVMRNRAVVLI